MAVARLSKTTFGLPHKYIRQLYKSVVQPKMEYALPVWYEPVRMGEEGRRKGSVGVMRKLGKVQRLAARIITGGFRTTATDVLDFHAGLPPIDLHLNRIALNAATRLATLPDHHPLHPHVKRCSSTYPRFHRSPIHELTHSFPETRQVETIDPTPKDPSWTPKVTTRIAPTREAAIKEAEEYERTSLCIYSDGSGYKGGIGAAAWAEVKGAEVGRRLHLGEMAHHTVFEGEVSGTILGLDIVAATPRITRVTILLDNQAAIRAIAENPARPGQHLVKLFLASLERLQKKRRTLQVHLAWIPGHEGVIGNEKADEGAKGAAEGDSTPLPRHLTPLTDIPRSAAATRAQGKINLRQEWTKRWKGSKHGRRVAKFDKSPPGKGALKAYQTMTKPECSIYTQLRSEHTGLNQYLSRFKIVDSPNCATCGVRETVDHYLFSCRRFIDQRHSMRGSLGRITLNKYNLLGKGGCQKELFRYVRGTARFPRYFEDPG